ncbi:hypothetical protein FOQG_11743 [Fusarium oxysporum f. sp. raphani 54005]|uniref:Uncharacterized protein n=5 Tax=Fusarium oxysporum TaxID=5507 RepID=X0BP91_FUSOX|nr:hypothetical protein FOXG_21131 [Fusarium oxysporum f. sp. lycopersici 4287]EXA36711.1 hypothetical protein FOVG_12595 [Fusarium oxysporum f. sp. pisi HDV247]EXK36409.1 hypothetical protein FOMG_09583 [Fusarium oxysporum f. sp. melonis 26406]EXK84010.1 hypothetical protein FOQG_11743 [Fusarium oxysporum f. sp. raphani 54005]EXL74721.1 hypothetical protein FOPG_10176 [Fusarium oxysporum f. sp. conglutinans race 2 54008]KNB14446.1 hypothetical protein FOXG_21131 [Fusarium oxysporum f. sp. lyc
MQLGSLTPFSSQLKSTGQAEATVDPDSSTVRR